MRKILQAAIKARKLDIHISLYLSTINHECDSILPKILIFCMLTLEATLLKFLRVL